MRRIPDTIRVTIATHKKSGLMVAVSPDVPGLNVHGNRKEEIEARIPIAVRKLVEADRKLAQERAVRLPKEFTEQKAYQLDLAPALPSCSMTERY
jgi:hypothetical protein